ncbi:UDP-N-acetylmuramate dehydrogenase [Methylobacillus flagellatus]|uniref:UDP-N-acetylenolpyruvoylglucosamine reductase n=1 Tax=Methylobacillus flagellatus (strain ATCC 51484 / DSM 6875 / VKM B-1610 / KT) TaxID=265072 RepID=Q1GZ03_METFK|nr:UDP-N-acetylmuramate dehydrogenase [Methylobacillus flagellatus]ABE50534.1 UDP-N-acetylmuramate dehydrogenase [Methylobacillus flagellatus KT]
MVEEGRLLHREPLARYTSWRTGGVADQLYIPASMEGLQQFLSGLPDAEPLHFIGLGSNLLVRDGGVRGTVILMHGALTGLRVDQGRIYAEAGVTCAKLARFAARQHQHGAEFMAGIPGTVGGALAMNAGCHGGETWEIVDRVLTIDRVGKLHERNHQAFATAYRHVEMPVADEWFVAAWFRLADGDAEEAESKIKQLLAMRLATQPLNLPNAGSVFRNPPGDHAARLIEASGLKGYRIGGAQVSEKHANFIVNQGDATARDIEQLILHVQAVVKQQQGVDLQPEVRVIGEDGHA